MPHGHYAHESMKATIVPNRNLTLLSVAAGYALSLLKDGQEGWVGYAAHAGDHAIYPDCRPEFVKAAEYAIREGSERIIRIWAPFLRWSKAQIVTEAVDLGVPLGETWSCYEGGLRHCGLCGTCVERKEAFAIAKVRDPTEYKA